MNITRKNRVIALEGAVNFRDMGGYQVADGRTVKYGLLFRSDQLGGLTGQDLQIVSGLRLRTILDYRSEGEAERSPTPALEGVDYRRLEASPLAALTNMHADKDALTRGIIDRETMIELYKRLPFANPAYRFLIDAMAHPDTERPALLHHCAGGKDRTGVGAALMLKLLNVSDEVIMDDYLLTNETLGPKAALMLEQLDEQLTPLQREHLCDTFVASADYLNAALEEIGAVYKSWDDYFEQEFGITAEMRARIVENYLE
ncbi:tyrosine-protein phosphatase [Paenibacillus sp. FSL H7-0331]|uniref:tyrosine-protein phosphatase n=1 Tax=Paenibacillus sp. FSL H7-0331 TaxID=1920421 RepID=UPI00096BFE54|nr:tyrosine-protein phosphatase [Paenibacillus sp. FSL H7-0331]OME98654.1 hypothetical protein BK127_39825 [Paenibacillus sp. FSL H7-0331]